MVKVKLHSDTILWLITYSKSATLSLLLKPLAVLSRNMDKVMPELSRDHYTFAGAQTTTSGSVLPQILSQIHRYNNVWFPISSSSQVHFVTPEVSQPIVSTKDQLSFDSSTCSKRVSVPRFSGNEKDFEGWTAAFMSCVDKAGATSQYQFLCFLNG